MIQVQPFTTDVLLTHKMFFLLNKLTKNAQEVSAVIQTPSGPESVDFIDVYSLYDGTLVAAWQHPFQKLSLHNLTILCDETTQVLNLFPLERIIDIYDRPINAEYGTFIFTKSEPISDGDWRCDKGMYGSRPFVAENVPRVITELGQVVYFEPFLSVNGVGHLMYIESNAKSDLANEKLNNSIVPVTGRTLQEVLRLIYEWSVLAKDPFNSKEEAAVSAKNFLESLKFTESETLLLESLSPMQVTQFISGSETARVRPDNITELTNDVKNIVFRRMGSSSLCTLLKIHGIPDNYDLLSIETQELADGISRFRKYYEIPVDYAIDEDDRIIEHCKTATELGVFPEQSSYIFNQLRFFRNKQALLDKIANDQL